MGTERKNMSQSAVGNFKPGFSEYKAVTPPTGF
jgi:hypothetical protein